MSNERFAQGEWVVNEKIMVAVNCGQKHIALVNIYNDGTDKSVLKDECLANARLISAAPDMYRALRRLVSDVELATYIEFGGTPWLKEKLAEIDYARAALAKADGETK